LEDGSDNVQELNRHAHRLSYPLRFRRRCRPITAFCSRRK